MIFIAISYTKFMDFMLEEELIDLYTFCLQNPDSPEVEQKKVRITEVGKESLMMVVLMHWKISILQYQIGYKVK